MAFLWSDKGKGNRKLSTPRNMAVIARSPDTWSSLQSEMVNNSRYFIRRDRFYCHAVLVRRGLQGTVTMVTPLEERREQGSEENRGQERPIYSSTKYHSHSHVAARLHSPSCKFTYDCDRLIYDLVELEFNVSRMTTSSPFAAKSFLCWILRGGAVGVSLEISISVLCSLFFKHLWNGNLIETILRFTEVLFNTLISFGPECGKFNTACLLFSLE